MMTIWLLLLCIHASAFLKPSIMVTSTRLSRRALDMKLGGDILVTGLGDDTEDEFMFGLLSEQAVWDKVILGRPEGQAVMQKRFLTRTARYSGLLNVLEFADTSAADSGVDHLLKTASAWLAFNLTADEVPAMQALAVASDVQRVIFTIHLPAHDINNTAVPELESARIAITGAGKKFTGLRHGTIVGGDEDNAYEIVNSTVPCLEPVVERGVLARVVSELLSVEGADDSICGVSSSSAFAAAYLNVLRSSGLSRNQEVAKMFTGGLQRVARLTVTEYELQAEEREKKRGRKAVRAAEKAEEERKEKGATARQRMEASSATPGQSTDLSQTAEDWGAASITPIWDEEEEEEGPTYEEKLEVRTKEILQNVWVEYDARMYAKSTSKLEFFNKNREKAGALATAEFEAERARRSEAVAAKRDKQSMLAKMVDVNRKQYSKLLALERKEMANQKVISDTWVKYIYLLVESTLRTCEQDGVLFNNLNEFAQTMALRNQANTLRAECGLPAYDVVYDPLDASVIVEKMEKSPLGQELGLQGGEGVMAALSAKHQDMLLSVTALRGASQIIELAVKTIKNELPPAPPTLDELRRTESASLQAMVSSMRLDALKKRGQPKTDAQGSVSRL